MAEENVVINGIDSEYEEQTPSAAAAAGGEGEDDKYYDVEQTKETKLNKRIETLEHERRELTAQVTKLTDEIDSLKLNGSDLKLKLELMEREVEKSEDGKRVLESVAARAVELETEVASLGHQLIDVMNEVEEANVEIAALRGELGEKEEKLEEVKKEKSEVERKVMELESKIGVVEVKEVEEKSKKIRNEEQMRGKIGEYEKRIGELEKELAEKLVLDEKLKESEEKVREMEVKVVELQKDMEAAGKIAAGMRERTAETINGITVENSENGYGGSNVEWPVLALGSAIAVVGIAAVVYLRYSRQT